MRDSQKLSGTFEDKTITCAECGASFTWTAGEQEFFRRRGFQQPKRCTNCRKKREPAQASA